MRDEDCPVVIYGAGGHGKVVLDSLLLEGKKVLGFVDDDPRKRKCSFHGYPFLGGIECFGDHKPGECRVIIAVGDNRSRYVLVSRISKLKHAFCTAVHPNSIVSQFAHIGPGSMVIGGAVIHIDTVVGNHAIINSGATVDHDCIISDCAHLAPGVHLGGRVSVGEGTLVGIGSSVQPGVKIGKWSVIGSGAAVTRDIPDYVVAVGVPARVIKHVAIKT